MEFIEQLNQIIINARKSIGRPYTADTINEKKLEIEKIEKDLNINIKDSEGKGIVDEFRKLKEEALNLLKIHLDKKSLILKRQDVAMASLDLNELSTITKLIPLFSGKTNELQTFLSNLEMVFESVSSDKRISFFNFVFKSRLGLNVQNRIKQIQVPTTIEELIRILKTTYKSLKTSNTLLNEITRISQKDNNILGFAAKIEKLITELNEVQVLEQGESSRSTIVNTNNKIAFNAFLNGLTDPQIISTIYASQVTTFSEALKIAENASSRVEQQRILHYNTQQNQNSSNRNCRKCGGNHNGRCPADGSKCHNCGKFNHFAKMCLTKTPGYNNRNYNNNNINYNNNGNNNNRNYNNNSNNNNRNLNNSNNRGNNNNRNHNNRDNNNNQRSRNTNNRSYNINHMEDQGNFQIPESTHTETPLGMN